MPAEIKIIKQELLQKLTKSKVELDTGKFKHIEELRAEKLQILEEKKQKEYSIDFTKDRKKIVVKKPVCCQADEQEIKKATIGTKIAAKIYAKNEHERILREEAERFTQLKHEKLHTVSPRFLGKELSAL